MPLPTISQPTFNLTIPSVKSKVKFRRFLVSEEKILLMAKQSESQTAIVESIIDVVQACAVDSIDVLDFKPFDLDYAFLQLRAQSVDNIVKIKFTDPVDEEHQHELEVNLDAVKPPKAAKQSITVKVDAETSVKIEYPSVGQMLAITKAVEEDSSIDISDYVVAAAITGVYSVSGEEHQADSEQEILTFINSFPAKAYQEITEFLDTIPQLSHTLSYTATDGEAREVVLNGIYDFFTF